MERLLERYAWAGRPWFGIRPAVLAATILALALAGAVLADERAASAATPPATPMPTPAAGGAAAQGIAPAPAVNAPSVAAAPTPLAAGPAAPAPVAPAVAPANPEVSASPAVPAAAANAAARTEDINLQPINRGPAPSTAATPASGAQSSGATAPAPSSLDLGRVAIALGAVLGLILFLRWGSRKLLALPAAGRASHLMQVVARTSLAPRQQLLLVRVGQRLIVVGDSAGQLSSLGHIAEPDEVATLIGQAKSAATPATPPNFGGMLRKISQKFRSRAAGGSVEEEDLGEQAEAERQTERKRLLDGIVARDPDNEDDRGEPADPPVGLEDPAVAAARVDIQSLRAKLREVSQRLSGTGGGETAGTTSG